VKSTGPLHFDGDDRPFLACRCGHADRFRPNSPGVGEIRDGDTVTGCVARIIGQRGRSSGKIVGKCLRSRTRIPVRNNYDNRRIGLRGR
jgi:hypothetical protein